jgi:DnaK suppressor protein
MAAQQQRYSQEELKEFETLLNTNLAKSKKEFDHLMESIKRYSGEGNFGSVKTLEDGAEALEKEQLNQLAARTQKYMKQLENALVRIKNGTYGICIDTGNLISKDRLRAVPHTQHSIEAKLNRK